MSDEQGPKRQGAPVELLTRISLAAQALLTAHAEDIGYHGAMPVRAMEVRSPEHGYVAKIIVAIGHNSADADRLVEIGAAQFADPNRQSSVVCLSVGECAGHGTITTGGKVEWQERPKESFDEICATLQRSTVDADPANRIEIEKVPECITNGRFVPPGRN
jgi:hypothetical protein